MTLLRVSRRATMLIAFLVALSLGLFQSWYIHRALLYGYRSVDVTDERRDLVGPTTNPRNSKKSFTNTLLCDECKAARPEPHISCVDRIQRYMRSGNVAFKDAQKIVSGEYTECTACSPDRICNLSSTIEGQQSRSFASTQADYTITTVGHDRTTVNMTESPPYLFTCQDENNGNNQFRSVLKDVLPEYVQQDMRQFGSSRKRLGLQLKKLRDQYGNTHQYDLFQLTDGGICTDIVEHWIRHSFRGKVILFSGEERNVQDKSSMPILRDYVYYLGPVPEDYHPNSLSLYYLQFVWWHELYNQGHAELIDPQRKPQNTGKNFLIYSQANCVPFREDAYDAISRLGEVHHGGRCHGKLKSKNKTKVDTGVTLSNWLDNIKSYRDYRFCLVMEHGTSEGYVTEKILMAFQAGCVPIYYGTRSIFDLFNEKAFIFYDIHNNTAALERIVELESNQTEYEHMMREPILAHGNQTVEQYFSFSDEVGGGRLKKRIRQVLGLDKFNFVT